MVIKKMHGIIKQLLYLMSESGKSRRFIWEVRGTAEWGSSESEGRESKGN